LSPLPCPSPQGEGEKVFCHFSLCPSPQGKGEKVFCHLSPVPLLKERRVYNYFTFAKLPLAYFFV